MSQNKVFEERFLRLCGYRGLYKGKKVYITFQLTSESSIPDLVVEVHSGNRSVALIMLEVKVESEIERDQIDRHLSGLTIESKLRAAGKKEPYSRLVIVAEPKTSPIRLPSRTIYLSWDQIYRELLECRCSEPIGRYVAEYLARELEAREMTEFLGFDIKKWREYVSVQKKNEKVFHLVEEQVAGFVKRLENRVLEYLKSRTKLYDQFREKTYGKGRSYQFWILGKEKTEKANYYVDLKAHPEEGRIETSIGAYYKDPTIRFLGNFKKSSITKKLADWSLWYEKGELKKEVDFDDYDYVIKMGPREAYVLHNRYLEEEESTFKTEKIFDETLDDLKFACNVFRQLH
ncbi:MAG: hypothetical protein ACW99U_15700 [Candidatus Thorarchaeota archaeon]|jgi:hypothetical protein